MSAGWAVVKEQGWTAEEKSLEGGEPNCGFTYLLHRVKDVVTLGH